MFTCVVSLSRPSDVLFIVFLNPTVVDLLSGSSSRSLTVSLCLRGNVWTDRRRSSDGPTITLTRPEKPSPSRRTDGITLRVNKTV